MIDVATNKHIVAFPSKIAAASGSPHQWNILLSANADNGTLCTLGNYVPYDNFAQGAVPTGFTGKILEKAANGNWYVQVTNAAKAIFLYNSPVSEYGEKLFQGEELYYNEKDSVVRGYSLIDTDIFEISENGFDGTPAANKAVTYSNGKYVVGS